MKKRLLVCSFLLFVTSCAPYPYGYNSYNEYSTRESNVERHYQAVCAKYRAKYGWSKGYTVNGFVISGNDLNIATSTLNYDVFGKYYVIFWDEGEASVIKLDFMLSNEISLFGQTGKDQSGRLWSLSSNTTFCY